MKKIIRVTLSGHPATFQMGLDADDALQSYLDRAKLRLGTDPDRDEVLRDLEQSIAEKLAQLPGVASRVISREELDTVLERVGAVDTDNAETAVPHARSSHRRRLCRIQQGRWLAGVCQGLAAYSSIRVGWVRLIVVILSIFIAFLSTILMFSSVILGFFTAAFPLMIYIGLMFTLPVVRKCDQYFPGYDRCSNMR